MKMTIAGKVHYLEPRLFAATGLTAQGFTTRHEGVSRPPYKSLNLGTNTFDDPHKVQGNRSLLHSTGSLFFGFLFSSFFWALCSRNSLG